MRHFLRQNKKKWIGTQATNCASRWREIDRKLPPDQLLIAAATPGSLVSREKQRVNGKIVIVHWETGSWTEWQRAGIRARASAMYVTMAVCKQTERDLAQTERVSSAAHRRDGTPFTKGRGREGTRRYRDDIGSPPRADKGKLGERRGVREDRTRGRVRGGAREFAPAASACPRGGARPDDRCPRGPAAPRSGGRTRTSASPWRRRRRAAAPAAAAPARPSACFGTPGRRCSRRRRRCGSPAGRRTRRSTRHRTSWTPGGSGTSRADGRTVSRTTAPVRRSRGAGTTAARRSTRSFYRDTPTHVQRAAALVHQPGLGGYAKTRAPVRVSHPWLLSRHTPLPNRAPPACASWHLATAPERRSADVARAGNCVAGRATGGCQCERHLSAGAIRLIVGRWEPFGSIS